MRVHRTNDYFENFKKHSELTHELMEKNEDNVHLENKYDFSADPDDTLYDVAYTHFAGEPSHLYLPKQYAEKYQKQLEDSLLYNYYSDVASVTLGDQKDVYAGPVASIPRMVPVKDPSIISDTDIVKNFTEEEFERRNIPSMVKNFLEAAETINHIEDNLPRYWDISASKTIDAADTAWQRLESSFRYIHSENPSLAQKIVNDLYPVFDVKSSTTDRNTSYFYKALTDQLRYEEFYLHEKHPELVSEKSLTEKMFNEIPNFNTDFEILDTKTDPLNEDSIQALFLETFKVRDLIIDNIVEKIRDNDPIAAQKAINELAPKCEEKRDINVLLEELMFANTEPTEEDLKRAEEIKKELSEKYGIEEKDYNLPPEPYPTFADPAYYFNEAIKELKNMQEMLQEQYPEVKSIAYNFKKEPEHFSFIQDFQERRVEKAIGEKEHAPEREKAEFYFKKIKEQQLEKTKDEEPSKDKEPDFGGRW